MSRSSVLVTLALWLPSAALAGRSPSEFKEPSTMSAEELEAAKARSKVRINGYADDIPQQTKPIPWGALGLLGLILLVVTPFAYRAYVSTARQLSPGGRTGGRTGPSKN